MAEKGGKVSGTGVKPVPMRLFATWEVEKSSPNCIPRLCSLTLTRLVVLKPLENELTSLIIAVKMQSSKRTLRSNEIIIPANGLLDTEIDLSFSLQYPHFLKREGNKLQIMLQRRKKYKNRTILGYKTLAIGQVNMAQVLQRAVDRELNLYSDIKERTNLVAQVVMLALSSQPVDHEENGNPKLQTADGVMYREYRSPDADITDDDEGQDDQEYWSGDEMSDSEPTPEDNARTRSRIRTREQIRPVIQRILKYPIGEDLSDNEDFAFDEKRMMSGRKHSRDPPSSSSRQRNFKQKFIALLKRFRVTDEVLDSEQDAELVDNIQNQREIEDLFDELEDLSDSGPEMDNLSVLSTPKPSLRPFFTGRGSQSDILDVPQQESGRLSDDSSKRFDSDRENPSDHELSDTPMVPPIREKDDRPPRKVLLENLNVILSSDDILPEHVFLVNIGEWQGQLLAQILENAQHKVICTCSAADVKATISYLVTKIQKLRHSGSVQNFKAWNKGCNSNSQAPSPIKMAIAGGDGYINSVLRPYVEQFSLKSPDWQHYIKFLVIPLGNSQIGRYIGSVDAVYNGLFVDCTWKEAFDKVENGKPDVSEILSRISKYVNGASAALQIPIAEVMITYKEKTMDEESSQNFVPFINEVRIGQIDLSGISSSVDLEDGALSPPGNLSSSPPTGSPLDKVKEHTPPNSPSVSGANPTLSPSMVTTPPPSGPVSEYMDLQLDYWIVSPKPDANEKEKSGKKEGNKNSLKTAFKSVSVHRLPQKSVNGEPLSSTLSMVVITKEKKQKGQYQFSVMRLGKKSKDVESKSQWREGINRLICTSKSQNNPITVTIDGVDWAGVKFFQLSSQWQTHIKHFPVTVFGYTGFAC